MLYGKSYQDAISMNEDVPTESRVFEIIEESMTKRIMYLEKHPRMTNFPTAQTVLECLRSERESLRAGLKRRSLSILMP